MKANALDVIVDDEKQYVRINVKDWLANKKERDELLRALETLMLAAKVDGWPKGWGRLEELARHAIANAKGSA